MQKSKMTGLQFFAESAAEGTETGAGVVIPADAGQNAGRPTLEELGVPKEKAASYRAFKGIPEPIIEQNVPETGKHKGQRFVLYILYSEAENWRLLSD